MKKSFSILFAVLIFLSGMHLQLVTHLCGGEVADVKLALPGEQVSCGMQSEESDISNGYSVSSRCCENEVSFYDVDDNYSPSKFQTKELSQNILQVFFIPVNLLFHITNLSNNFPSNVSPPGNLLAGEVHLDNICVFRI